MEYKILGPTAITMELYTWEIPTETNATVCSNQRSASAVKDSEYRHQ